MPPQLRAFPQHLTVFLVLLSIPVSTLTAQVILGPTTIRQNVRNDVSLPLRVMVKTAPPPDLTRREVEPMKRIPLPQGLAPFLEEDPLRQASVPAVASPTVSMSFEGLGTANMDSRSQTFRPIPMARSARLSTCSG